MSKQTFALTLVNKCQVAIYICHLKCKLVSEMDKRGGGIRPLAVGDERQKGRRGVRVGAGALGSRNCRCLEL